MKAGEKFRVRSVECGVGACLAEINHRHGAFARNEAHWVHADEHAAACGAGDVLAFGPPPAPVAHVSLLAGERHAVGLDANLPEPQHASTGGIQLGEPVGEIERDIEAPSVRGHGHAGWDFGAAPRRLSWRQRDRKQAHDLPRLLDSEDFDVAIHVRQVNAGAVGRKDQAGEAELAFLVWMQDLIGNGFWRIS